MIGRAAGPSDRYWQEQADKLTADSLIRVQSAAEKWAGTIASLTGILGIVAFVKGPEDVTKLTGGYEYAVPACLGLAVLCAVLATVLAAFVAQGVPEEFYNTGPAVRVLYQTKTKSAIRWLNWSRGLALIATLLLVIAVGLNWYGDRVKDPSTASSVVVVRSSGQVACGTLAVDGAGQTYLDSQGNPSDLTNVVSLSVVEQCPT